jgi:hypothetical protein
MKHSSEKDWNSIDSSWRNKLLEENSPVPAGLWEKLSDRLDAEEKPKVFFIRAWQWAAVLAIGLGLSWLWLLPRGEKVAHSSNFSRKSIAIQASPLRPLSVSKSLPSDQRKISATDFARLDMIQKVNKRPIEKNMMTDHPMPVKEELAQNTTLPTNSSVDIVPEKEEAVWLKVEIDPVVRTSEGEVETVAEVTPMKKRSFGQFIKKIKQVIKGNPGEWSEIKENFHLVANKYIQTEETIKQKFQIQ